MSHPLLARAAARRKEIAVRMALGSGRKRLVRQLLTESLLLAGSGGLLGLGVAFLGGRLVAAFMEGQDVVLGVSPDTRVLGFTAVISLASALLFGLMPSMTATRGDLNSWLGDQSRATAGAGRLTIHNAIVVFQIALSVVVLIAAGLFGRTLTNLQQLDTGYAPENLTVFGIDVPGGYDSDRRAALYRAVVDTLEASPGTKASYSAFGVLSGNGLSDPVGTPGYSPRSGESLRAYGTIVSPGFFEATGARIVFGRDFERADDGSPVRVAVVNQAMRLGACSGSGRSAAAFRCQVSFPTSPSRSWESPPTRHTAICEPKPRRPFQASIFRSVNPPVRRLGYGCGTSRWKCERLRSGPAWRR
jgi:hypothetical protein